MCCYHARKYRKGTVFEQVLALRFTQNSPVFILKYVELTANYNVVTSDICCYCVKGEGCLASPVEGCLSIKCLNPPDRLSVIHISEIPLSF